MLLTTFKKYICDEDPRGILFSRSLFSASICVMMCTLIFEYVVWLKSIVKIKDMD